MEEERWPTGSDRKNEQETYECSSYTYNIFISRVYAQINTKLKFTMQFFLKMFTFSYKFF
jgi:hypothetical protein